MATYATDYIIAEGDMDIINFKMPAGQSAVEYVQALWGTALRCRPVYDKYRLKETFSEVLRQKMSQSCCTKNSLLPYNKLHVEHCPFATHRREVQTRIRTVSTRMDKTRSLHAPKIINVYSTSSLESLTACVSDGTLTPQQLLGTSELLVVVSS